MWCCLFLFYSDVYSPALTGELPIVFFFSTPFLSAESRCVSCKSCRVFLLHPSKSRITHLSIPSRLANITMLYRGLRLAARTAPKFALCNSSSALRQLPIQFQHVRTYADTIVKVPQMAESISEGTLKQWNKSVGDHVEQDEEIATIETDKVRFTGRNRKNG